MKYLFDPNEQTNPNPIIIMVYLCSKKFQIWSFKPNI
jgi:hypothetical protein